MKRFLAWWQEGEYTADGKTFDIGRTTQAALRCFRNRVPIEHCGGKEERDNGNGGLMRILPQVLYELCVQKNQAIGEKLERIYEVTALTHAHKRSLLASGLYFFIVRRLWNGGPEPLVRQVQNSMNDAKEFYRGKREWSLELRQFERLFDIESFSALPEEQIKSGGYVVDTLEAAVWCLLRGKDYSSTVLAAVNLGDDTDTVAAIAGSMAGIWYGKESIPEEWLSVLARREWIEELCEKFALETGRWIND